MVMAFTTDFEARSLMRRTTLRAASLCFRLISRLKLASWFQRTAKDGNT
jgi:hypothetical protein